MLNNSNHHDRAIAKNRTQIVRVALDVPLYRLFDYKYDEENLVFGQRVVVPFAGRELVGVVLEVRQESEVSDDKLKSVVRCFEDWVLDQATYRLLVFCANYYHYPIGQTIIAALPLRLRQTKPAISRKVYRYHFVKWPDNPLNKRQVVLQKLLTRLQENKVMNEAQLRDVSSSWRKALETLIKLDCVRAERVLAISEMWPISSQEPQLNPPQKHAVHTIQSELNQFKPWLLYGVTGSGKTEVYMQVMTVILSQPDAQVLVLVPEINLTPQLEARFRARLSRFPLVTLHSSLSEGERLQNWLAAASGQARIVIGTRLSVFTPMPHLKMIIIDEEHDASYKQQDGMRYHARDVAVMRAKQLHIPIILGSATPALETWYNANKPLPLYQLISLDRRAVAEAQLPSIECIDTTRFSLQEGLSSPLLEALRSQLQSGEQSLLFLNRRGYAPVLHCNACQWTGNCKRCSARLVVHLKQRRLKCHHCGYEQKMPLQCPSCGNPDLSPVGQATQRLMQTLERLFTDARIARVDRDSVTGKQALTQVLTAMHNDQLDILVGTQMLAKGHDFPNLTLVGVMDVDAALYSPDFRASERLFSQLMQVSGRAGRDVKPGRVLIQTAFPGHPLFLALQANDYATYANILLEERRQWQLPPFSYLALLKAEANDYALVLSFLNRAKAITSQFAHNITVYDPVRPQMERLKGMERGYLLCQSESRQSLQHLLAEWIPALKEDKLSNKLRWHVDIDPQEF